MATLKLKRTTKGIDVIQSVYAVAMGLALTDVFVGAKSFLNDVMFGAGTSVDGRTLLLGLLIGDIVLLGLRFFWVPRNLSSLVHKAAECRRREGLTDRLDVDLESWAIAMHLVIVFIHGALFFLICSEFEYIAFLASSSIPLNGAAFTGFITMQTCLLLTNAAWIGVIKLHEARIERRAQVSDDVVISTGGVWWVNNLVCALIAIAPFSVLGACHSDLTRCVAQNYSIGDRVFDGGPMSPDQLSVLFQGVAQALGRLGLETSDPALIWALVFFLINSLIDLGLTGRDYLFFDDVEWEGGAVDGGKSAAGGAPA